MGALLHNTFLGNFFSDIAKRSTTKSSLGSLGTQITTSVAGVKSEVGTSMNAGMGNATYNFVKTLPISPTFTLETFAGEMKNVVAGNDKSFDSLSNVLEDVTGVNLNLMAENVTSVTNVEERIKEYILSIERQVVDEVKGCIDKYLQSLINKNPEIEILLDLEGALIKELGKLRRMLRLKIEADIENILYRRIKIQQIAAFRQKITKAIRGICPSTHHSLAPVQRVSPTLTSRLQADTTWKLPDGKTELKNLAIKDSIEAVHYVEQGNSTGQLVIDVASNATDSIASEGRAQAVGYSDETMDDLFDDNGNVT
jgi:hypothetical protein